MSLKNSVPQPGIDPGTVRLVAQRLNHYATPGPRYVYIYTFYSQYRDAGGAKEILKIGTAVNAPIVSHFRHAGHNFSTLLYPALAKLKFESEDNGIHWTVMLVHYR